MDKPVIIAVDDEPVVLAAVVRDLRRQYGRDYSVLRATSAEQALDVLRQLRLAERPVALLVVDQRMPGMTGVELLREAIRLYPDARRVLLTAYADTEAAIHAINEVRLDHYLMKPWDPPEEHLYPVLTGLLEDWQAGYVPPFEGIRVVGHAWSPAGHDVRDFLARNLVPYRWLDAEDHPDAPALIETAGAGAGDLPLVVFPDGSHVTRPSHARLAAKLGLHTEAELESYDLLIVGAGPAGLAAAVYGASEGLSTVLIEREAPGGQAGLSSRIENYLGFPAGLSGGDLTRRAVAQARRLGAEILAPREVTEIELRGDYRVVHLDDGTAVNARAVLIATGVSYRLLDVPGADRLAGAGVYYGAAMTEAAAVRGRDVFVVGGGNSAGQAAMHLSRFARSVTLLVRRDSLEPTMSAYLIEQLDQTDNITVRPGTTVAGVDGDKRLETVTLRTDGADQPERVPADALFIFIGAAPRTDWVPAEVARDGRGFILSGHRALRDGHRPEGWTAPRDPLWLETSVPGIFVAGDVRSRSVKRIASAVGEGSMAVQFVHVHLNGSVLAKGTRPRSRNGGRVVDPAGDPVEDRAAGGAEGQSAPESLSRMDSASAANSPASARARNSDTIPVGSG